MAKVTREVIIDAAVRLFNQNGYHATAMRDIARVIDIKKPSIYHHFDSKEDILLAILEQGMDQLVTEIEQIALSEEDSVTKLRLAIKAHAGMIASNPEGAAVFLREDRGLGEHYLEEYLSKRDQVDKLFRSIIREGIAEGKFRTTDISISTQALLGMVNWMTRWYRPEGRLSAEEITDIFFDLFLNGIQA